MTLGDNTETILTVIFVILIVIGASLIGKGTYESYSSGKQTCSEAGGKMTTDYYCLINNNLYKMVNVGNFKSDWKIVNYDGDDK